MLHNEVQSIGNGPKFRILFLHIPSFEHTKFTIPQVSIFHLNLKTFFLWYLKVKKLMRSTAHCRLTNLEKINNTIIFNFFLLSPKKKRFSSYNWPIYFHYYVFFYWTTIIIFIKEFFIYLIRIFILFFW